MQHTHSRSLVWLTSCVLARAQVTALYDYQAQRSDELSFVKDEVIKVLYRDNDNWWMGELEDGQQGFFPVNYVAGCTHARKQRLLLRVECVCLLRCHDRVCDPMMTRVTNALTMTIFGCVVYEGASVLADDTGVLCTRA